MICVGAPIIAALLVSVGAFFFLRVTSRGMPMLPPVFMLLPSKQVSASYFLSRLPATWCWYENIRTYMLTNAIPCRSRRVLFAVDMRSLSRRANFCACFVQTEWVPFSFGLYQL